MSEKLEHSFSHPPPRSKSSMGSIDHSRDLSPDRKVNLSIRNNAPNAYKTTDASDHTLLRKKYAMSVKEMVRCKSKRVQDWGIEGYWIPKYNAYMDKPQWRKWVKNKLPDFWSLVKKRSQQTPSPDHYQKNVQLIGRNKKFYTSKLPRETEIDIIFKTKKAGPTPFSYNPHQIKSKGAFFSSKLDRNGFIEDAKARANDSPPPYVAKYSLVQPRLQGRGFYPTKKDSFAPIKKTKDPDWGSYDTKNGYEKTIKRIRIASFSKYNLPLIQDLKVKDKKWVPAPGQYKWENSFDKSTRAPLFRKGKY